MIEESLIDSLIKQFITSQEVSDLILIKSLCFIEEQWKVKGLVFTYLHGLIKNVFFACIKWYLINTD
jgi:hypothetical protein